MNRQLFIKRITCGGLAVILWFGWLLLSPARSHADAQNADQQTSEIPEVIVTAQKREERLQDVPIAITAISGAAITAKGVTNADDLQNVVPSLSWSRAGAFATPFIRGVGSLSNTAGNESAVAIYVDGVLQISPQQSLFSLNNVDHVEVLKGPQGTLFGRNADGGVISIVTRRPSAITSMDASVGFGNYQSYNGDFYGTTGVTDGLSADLAVVGSLQHEGWGRSIVTGATVGDNQSYDIRSKWLWAPGPDDEVMLTLGYSSTLDGSAGSRLIPGELGVDGVTRFPGFYNSSSDIETYYRTKVYQTNVHAEHKFDWARLVSISSYADVKSLWSFDSDYTPQVIEEGPINIDTSGFTQEFQLVSPTDQVVRWVAGVFYLNDSSAFDPLTLLGSAVGGQLNIVGKERVKSLAGFGEATWSIRPDTRLIVGGRYTSDRREVSGGYFAPSGPLFTADQSKRFSKPTYRVTLDHNLSDGVMVYGTANSGYKSGRFNTTNAALPAVEAETLKGYELGLKSEGFERRLEANASAFRYSYDNLQSDVDVGNATTTINAGSAIVKGIDLDVTARPIQKLTLQLGIAYLSAKYTDFTNAAFFVPLPSGGREVVSGDAKGKTLVRAPKLSTTAAIQYDLYSPVGKFTPSVNYSYKSRFYWDYQNDFVEPAHNILDATLTWNSATETTFVRLWGKNLLKAESLAYGAPTPFGYSGSPNPPMTFGVTLGAHF